MSRNQVGIALSDNETFFANALAFRTAANDLYRMMNELAPAGGVPAEHAVMLRLFAYTMSITVLRALSAECMLKSILLAHSGSFDRKHDLSLLYEALDGGIRSHIEREADSSGIADPRRILDRHRTDFVDWRYPPQAGKSTNFRDLDRVLQVLEDVYRQIKAGNAP